MDAIEKRAHEIRDRFCPPGDYDYSDILDAIIAALTPPEGYVLLPFIPSYEMTKALADTAGCNMACAALAYLDALSARPEVP